MGKLNQSAFIDELKQILSIFSPSGYGHAMSEYLCSYFEKHGLNGTCKAYAGLGVEFRINQDKQGPVLGFCSHFDTLGHAVASIGSDGTIRLTKIGGIAWTQAEGCEVTLRTLDNKEYTGTIQFEKTSVHLHGSKVDDEKRTQENMFLRLDEKVSSREDVEKLGIHPGDPVFTEPGFKFTDSGYLKSRYLDNKMGVALMLSLIHELQKNPVNCPVSFFFTGAEEIGKGSVFVDHVDELVIVDVAIAGGAQASKEDKVTICAQDSCGPFDYTMRKELAHICQKKNLPWTMDVFLGYGSDSEPVLKKGVNAKTALIGPGVDSSHSVERTHWDAVDATYTLMEEYCRQFATR